MDNSLALTAAQVGQIVIYIAPGFLAQLGYRMRYPAPEKSAGQVLIISVVLSLPLVAITNAALNGSHKATNLGYVAVLMIGSFIIGYLVALARGRQWAKALLRRLDYHAGPENSIYAQTLKHMSRRAPVLIEIKDGRRVSGTVAIGPEMKDDGINELYLTHPEAEQPDGNWRSVGAGMIIPLSEVSNIVLSEDPTGLALDEVNGAQADHEDRAAEQPVIEEESNGHQEANRVRRLLNRIPGA